VPLISSRPPTIDIDIVSVPVRLCLPNNLLYLDKDEVFGELDDRTTKILVSMGREKGINFQIYCRSVARTTILGKRKNHKGIPQGSRFLMNVVLYGPDELYNVVGKYLTKCGIHLQDPQCDRDLVYRNPHVLFESEGVVMTSSLREICNPSAVEDMINEEDIFSKLSSDDHLSLTEAPDAIQTILYR
jgi:SWI/SNF-related matrix-associated actin-dependent regulator of chromatin subfamily A3